MTISDVRDEEQHVFRKYVFEALTGEADRDRSRIGFDAVQWLADDIRVSPYPDRCARQECHIR